MKYVVGLIFTIIIVGTLIWANYVKKDSLDNNVTYSESPEDVSELESENEIQSKKLEVKNNSKDMKIEITKEGTGAAIVNGQNAVMLYTGKLEDGTVFDSTAKRNNDPFIFNLGAGMVIKGWDEGVLGMKVGEERTLTIPYDMAYGENGIPGVIPPKATLIFDVVLLEIK